MKALDYELDHEYWEDVYNQTFNEYKSLFKKYTDPPSFKEGYIQKGEEYILKENGDVVDGNIEYFPKYEGIKHLLEFDIVNAEDIKLNIEVYGEHYIEEEQAGKWAWFDDGEIYVAKECIDGWYSTSEDPMEKIFYSLVYDIIEHLNED